MSGRHNPDLVSGGVLAAAGVGIILYALDRYQLGTLGRMGPGMFPVGLGAILTVLGLVIAAQSLHRDPGRWQDQVPEAKDKSRFGKGAVEGLAGPEASNNAADQAAFIPTLTLGIPGTPVLAILLGVLIIHGINPGPNLVFEEPKLFWGLVMSFWIGNIVLLFLNVPLIGLWVKVLSIPYRILYPWSGP